MKIKKLDLSCNSLRFIPKVCLYKNEFLEYLNVSKNSIEVIEEGAFQDLTRIVNLHLDQNQLQYFIDFPNSATLDNIVLSYNKIEYFEGFEKAPNLTSIVLNNN